MKLPDTPGGACGRAVALITMLLSLHWQAAHAGTYLLPPEGTDLVGRTWVTEAAYEDTLLDIAKRYDVGQNAILLANPEVDRWLPGAGTRVLIPTWHILPPGPRKGLVLNLPEMRLYYYPQTPRGLEPLVYTYPIGIGRMDWSTPLGETSVVSKVRDPAWYPPESIRAEHAADGDPLPKVVPAGPDNPLGRYAIRLGIPGYLIHGTNKIFGVGMRVSHGCIRLSPEDIEQLFGMIPTGTPVRFINQSVKLGWSGGELYLEMHPPLEEDGANEVALYNRALALAQAELARASESLAGEPQAGEFQAAGLQAGQPGWPLALDTAAIREAVAQPTGMPVKISVRL